MLAYDGVGYRSGTSPFSGFAVSQKNRKVRSSRSARKGSTTRPAGRGIAAALGLNGPLSWENPRRETIVAAAAISTSGRNKFRLRRMTCKLLIQRGIQGHRCAPAL